MPQEMRKISFSQIELQAALVDYAQRSEMRLPDSDVEDVIVSKENGVSVKLVFTPSDPSEIHEVEFAQEHVAAAIILYCRTQDVPLVRDARKVLIAEEDSVSMMIQIENEEPEPNYDVLAASAARETLEDAESEIAASVADERLAEN